MPNGDSLVALEFMAKVLMSKLKYLWKNNWY